MARKLVDKYLVSGEEDYGNAVFQGLDLSTGREVGVKVFKTTNLDHADRVREVLEWETEILGRTNAHPNVVQLLDVLNTPTETFVVMDTVAGRRDLFDVIEVAGRLEDGLARHFFGQILDAVEHCHDRGVCHRDIKPENVLVDPACNAKLTGLSVGWVFDPSKGDDGVKISQSTIGGTLDYIAPEVIQALGYAGTPGSKSYAGRPADLWSLGVTLYTMLTGYLPFEAGSEDAVADKVQAGNFRVDPAMTASARALLDCLLEVDPKKRFTVEQVRSHLWFRRNHNDHHQQQHTPDESSPGPCPGSYSGNPVGKGHLIETGSQRDGPGDDAVREKGEEKGEGRPIADNYSRLSVVHCRTQGQATPALPHALRQPLPKPRHVRVFDVDDDFNGDAEAAAFLYGDDNDNGSESGKSGGDALSVTPSSPPSGFNSPVWGLESLLAADPPRPRPGTSDVSMFESVPSSGGETSGFGRGCYGAQGTGGGNSSILSDERSRRLDTFSSYAVSEDDRGRLGTSSTCDGELFEEEEGAGEERPHQAMGWSMFT